MKIVKVKFENKKYDYYTSVNPNCSNESIREYFVGSYLDMGVFPKENMQQCVSVDIENDRCMGHKQIGKEVYRCGLSAYHCGNCTDWELIEVK